MSISAVSVSQLTRTKRIDAECYQPRYLTNIDFLKNDCKYPVVPLGAQLTSITGGATPLGADYPHDGVPFLRVQNIMPGYLDLSDVVYISPEVHSGELKRSQLQFGDVLLTITGMSYGKAAYVPPDLGEANINQHSVRMSLRDGVLPEYVAMFLNSCFGKLQSDRKVTGDTRPALDYEEIRSILLPVPPLAAQKVVSHLLHKAEEKRKLAEQLYAEAERLLSAELGLDRLDLSESLFNVRRVSDVLNASRMDAEHYRQKYYRVLESLGNIGAKEVVPLKQIAPTLTNGHTPLHHDLDVGDTPFLTAEHVYDFWLDYDNARRVWKEQHETELKRTHLRENDVLITIKGRVGNAVVVDHLPGDVNINQDVALLRLKPGIHPYYVVGFLNSPAGKSLMEQMETGQINPFLGLGNLAKVPIPLFDAKRMNAIGENIRQVVSRSYQARQDAKRLLAEAKAEVERLIEGG